MALKCHSCADEIEGQPVRKGERVYYSEACAFDGLRSRGCDDRPDSTVAGPIAEPIQKREE